MEITVRTITEIEKQLKEFFSGKGVFICGVSVMGKTLARWMDEHDLTYEAFVDKKGRADWTTNKVYDYDELACIEKANKVFVITQKYYKEEVTRDLKNAGVSKTQILTFLDDAVFDEFYYDLNRRYTSKKFVNIQFKNKYEGERCFVIGHGPSLREIDLIKLKNERTFTVNAMYEHFSRLCWHPTFFFCSDRVNSQVFEKNQESFFELLSNAETVFFEEKTGVFQKYADASIENLFFYRSKMPTYVQIKEAEDFFSEDITESVYTVGTVLYDELQFAAYMGFKEIYLIGVDFQYAHELHLDGKRVDHRGIERNYADFLSVPLTYDIAAYEFVDRMLAGYLAAKKYADAHDIKIYNATRGGKLEVFPRVNLDTLFS